MQDDMILVADVGNTTISIGGYQNTASKLPAPHWSTSISNASPDFSAVQSQLQSHQRIHIASVCQPAKHRLVEYLKQASTLQIREITYQDLKLSIDLPHPERVGIDRLLGAVAANQVRLADRGAIVVDAGSAITIDAISSDGVFLGGQIMAGFRMKTDALAACTDQLPLVNPDINQDPPPLIGTDTVGAIQSGIYWGTVGSIQEVISRLSQQLDQPHVLMTGGDMKWISQHIRDAEFIPELILSGLAVTARTIDS